MTLPIGKPIHEDDSGGSAAFTLIELILVMAVLVIAIAWVTPRLTSFFRGRALDAEARRLLTLTHFAQSRAVSEGLPMMLWFDSRSNTYGLQVQPGFVDEHDDKAIAYQLGQDLELRVDTSLTASQLAPATRSSGLPPHLHSAGFTPDGLIALTSPEVIWIHDGQRETVRIGLSRNRLCYEIQTNSVPASSPW